MFEKIPCPVCQSKKYKVLRESTYSGGINSDELMKIYSASSNHVLMDQLVQCDECCLVYVNPQIEENIILNSYTDAVDPTFVSQNQWRVATFSRNLEAICKKTNMLPSKDKKILDVGCAGGAFVKAAHDLGFTAVGVEPSKWLSEKARETYGLDIRTGSLETQKFDPDSFDVVTLWDVIEHLVYPGRVLSDVRMSLKKDGLLVVNFPDYQSLMRRLLKWRWPFFLSVHLIYFTRRTIQLFLEKNGFEVVEQRPYWQTLTLGYAMERACAYFPMLRFPSKVLESIGVANVPFRYNMGQTLLVARKC